MCKPHGYSENNTKKPACGETTGEMRCLQTRRAPPQHGIWFWRQRGKSWHVSSLKRGVFPTQQATCKPSLTCTEVKHQDTHIREKRVLPKGALVRISYSKNIYLGNKLLSNISFNVWLTVPTGIIHTMETMIDNLLKKCICFLHNVSSVEPR